MSGSTFLFVGGGADGLTLTVDGDTRIVQRAKAGVVYEKETYIKHVCWSNRGRNKDFYFALASMSDEDALEAYLKKQCPAK